MQTLEIAGNWWLPESPESTVQGHLLYAHDGGIQLTIPIGHLGDSSNDPALTALRPTEYAVVMGLLEDGRCATLTDVGISARRTRMPGFSRETWWANAAYIGPEDVAANPCVSDLEVTYSHLLDWTGLHIGTHQRVREEGYQAGSFDYRYRLPLEQELARTDEWTLLQQPTMSESFTQPGTLMVETSCSWRLRFATPQPVNEVRDRYLTPLKQWLEFCVYRPVCTRRAVAKSPGESAFFDLYWIEPSGGDETGWLPPSSMLLPQTQIGTRLQSVIPRWLAMTGDERRAIGLMVGLLDKEGYSDLRFLAAAQALEALARVDASEAERTPEEFRARVDSVLSTTDRKLRPWLASKLSHANRRDTRSLERDLLRDIGAYVTSISPDIEELLADIGENRNFYTHRDDRDKTRILEGRELLVLTIAVRLLLAGAALRRLGFAQDEVEHILLSCDRTYKDSALVADMYNAPRPIRRYWGQIPG